MQHAPTTNTELIATKLRKLQIALTTGAPRKARLQKWSEFIRERDGNRCVDCHSTQKLAAHHICRKSFLSIAEFQTGNGITLCGQCHRELHQGFNGRADFQLPVDAQGGEKLHRMERFYSILTDDAVERGLLYKDFYHLSDDVLKFFKRMQGYEDWHFPGAPIEQAYLILAECEHGIRKGANSDSDIPIPDRPLLPGGLYLVFPQKGREPRKAIVVQSYVTRWERTANCGD
ncbi:HNH endonuclease [Rhodopseudomonas palustris]|uniref:HNH endonuclease n=1 Tax=Rhodopseudomonas palustris TaxID=1076 RepID=UPI0011B0EF88|nr:HNH endonuclease [Rhodopseudomonas palustris]